MKMHITFLTDLSFSSSLKKLNLLVTLSENFPYRGRMCKGGHVSPNNFCVEGKLCWKNKKPLKNGFKIVLISGTVVG